jgi:hypothetical protein
MPECCVVDCGRANALSGTVFYTSDGSWRELGLRGLDDRLARSGAESIVTLQRTATIQRGFQLLDKSRRVSVTSVLSFVTWRPGQVTDTM